MNIYCEFISKISLPNKYTKIYIQLITKAIYRASSRKEARQIFGYIEKHHILPKSFKLGGESDQYNYAFMSAREHFICHRLLTKMFTGQFKAKMIFALNRLSLSSKNKNHNKITSRVYQFIRTDFSKSISGEGNGRYGKNISKETRNKLSSAQLGKKASNETKIKMSIAHVGNKNSRYGKSPLEYMSQEQLLLHKRTLSALSLKDKNHFYGKHHTIDSKTKMSLTHKNLPKEKCEYCDMITTKTNIKRWHGKNCKNFIQIRK